MTFGDRLRDERERLGLSGRSVSRAAGMCSSYAWDVEHGRIVPRLDVAERLASAVGLTAADLMVDGPALLEVEFAVHVDEDVHGSLMEHLPESVRASVAMWPRGETLRLRVRASAIGDVVALSVPGVSLPAPTVARVAPSPTLAVMVRTERRAEACRMVLAETTRLDCCPPLDLNREGQAWVARLRGLPERCSLALQRLAPDAPRGLFHPA